MTNTILSNGFENKLYLNREKNGINKVNKEDRKEIIGKLKHVNELSNYFDE